MRYRCLRTEALRLHRPIKSLELPIRLGVVRRCPNVAHPRYPHELLKLLGDELRTVIGDNPGGYSWAPFQCSLAKDLYIVLLHRFPNIPVDDVPAAPIEYRHEVVKRPANVEVRNVDVPMLVWL